MDIVGVVNDDRLFAPGWHEDFHSSVVIAVGALVERALDAPANITMKLWPGACPQAPKP